jgi:asparagine synthase (glutamine-hydrolysing)
MSLFAACLPRDAGKAEELGSRLVDALYSINGLRPVLSGSARVILVSQPRYDELGRDWAEVPDDRLVGEFHLTNGQDLESQLRIGNGRFPGAAQVSDRGLVRQALQKWQEAAPERLHGAFAFACWNPAADALFLARDRLGAVPLYYSLQTSGMWISNSLKALLVGIPGTHELDKGELVKRLMGLNENDPASTQYKNFRRFPPAHLSTIQLGNSTVIQPRRYWRLGGGSTHPVSDNFEENAATLRRLLEASVQQCLPRSGRVGIELSGGLDSTAISGLAARHCQDRIESCTAIFPGLPQSDEKEYVDHAVSHQGISNHQFVAQDLDAADYFEKSIEAFGSLHLSGNIHISMHIQECLAERNCVTVLNGVDGDNVASHGLCLLRELAAGRRWREFKDTANSISDIFAAYSDNPGLTFFRAFGQKILDEQAASGFTVGHVRDLVEISRLTGQPFARLLRRSLSRRLRGFDPPRKPASRLFRKDMFNQELLGGLEGDLACLFEGSRPDDASSEREEQLSVLQSGVTEQYFELTHALSAANRLYSKSPFMDPEVIEFCLDVPADHKLRDGWNRAMLRKGLEAELGPKVAWRRWKSDLSPGLKTMLEEVCLPWVQGYMAQPGHPLWACFDREAAQLFVQEYKDTGGGRPLDGHRLWALWALGRFLEADWLVAQ